MGTEQNLQQKIGKSLTFRSLTDRTYAHGTCCGPTALGPGVNESIATNCLVWAVFVNLGSYVLHRPEAFEDLETIQMAHEDIRAHQSTVKMQHTGFVCIHILIVLFISLTSYLIDS